MLWVFPIDFVIGVTNRLAGFRLFADARMKSQIVDSLGLSLRTSPIGMVKHDPQVANVGACLPCLE